VVDSIVGWITRIDGIVPPFCVELVMRDGQRYFLHSYCTFDEQSETMVVKIWDVRELAPGDIDQIKKRLKEISQTGANEPPTLHPTLDWANLHARCDEILYCIEWHDRSWPDEGRPKLGFGKS